MIIVLYFDFISKHYVWIASVCIVLGVFCVSGTVFMMDESPLWMLKMGKIEPALKSLRRMAKFNGFNADEEIDEIAVKV